MRLKELQVWTGELVVGDILFIRLSNNSLFLSFGLKASNYFPFMKTE